MFIPDSRVTLVQDWFQPIMRAHDAVQVHDAVRAG